MRTPVYSDERLIADLAAAAAEVGEPLTATAYDTWQRARDAASPALVIRRLGSWAQACAQAGVVGNDARAGVSRWSDDAVVAIVAAYLRDPGSAGTFAGYSAWAREQDDVPSGATLRQRFQWSEVKQRASADRG